MRRVFAWSADIDRTGVVQDPDGVDRNVLTPWGDISALQETLVLEQVRHSKRPKPLLDFVSSGSTQPILLSDRALAVVHPFLRPNGSLTKVLIRDDHRTFYAFKPQRILDVLDETRSAIKPTSYGRYLVRASFQPYDFEDCDVFAVKGFEDLHIFVTDAFVKAAADARLEGADFEPQIMSFDKS